jgi:hypothetical protein
MLRGALTAGAIAVAIAGAPVAHAAPSTTTPSPAPTTGSSVYYKNCAEACADGVAPIYRGSPATVPAWTATGTA